MTEQEITVKEGEIFIVYCGKHRYYVSLECGGIEEQGVDLNYEEGIAKGNLLR